MTDRASDGSPDEVSAGPHDVPGQYPARPLLSQSQYFYVAPGDTPPPAPRTAEPDPELPCPPEPAERTTLRLDEPDEWVTDVISRVDLSRRVDVSPRVAGPDPASDPDPVPELGAVSGTGALRRRMRRAHPSSSGALRPAPQHARPPGRPAPDRPRPSRTEHSTGESLDPGTEGVTNTDTVGATANDTISAPAAPTTQASSTQALTAAAGRRLRRFWRPMLALLLAAVLAVLTAIVLVRDDTAARRPAGRTSAVDAGAAITDLARAQGFLAGASSAIAAVTSYDYRDLESAVSAGTSVTTGQYRTDYVQALRGALGATAKRDELVQTFTQSAAGIGEISADGATAKVLIFGVETVTASAAGASGSRRTAVTLTATIVHRSDTYLIGELQVGANAGLPPGSPQLAVAAEAGRSEIVNLLTYARATFDFDYDRATAGAVAPLLTRLAAGRADTRSALQRGHYDLRGAVTAVAVRSASADTVELLVAATGTKVPDSGPDSVLEDARYLVTVVRFQGTWFTSIVTPVTAG